MDAEDLLRDSASERKGKDGAGKARPNEEPDENKDYVDIGKDPVIETEENGVIEVREKGGSGLEQPSQPVKQEITSLDLHFLVRELRKALIGGVFRKIYQYGGRDTKQMIFGFHVPRQGQRVLYVDNRKLFLTTKKEPAPQEPTSFCMFLRKHLMDCPSCRALVQDHKALRRWFAPTAPIPVPAG